MRQSAVSFKAKNLSFEGVVAQPEGDLGPFPGVVVCHPHPLFGGNMDNNVVLSLAYSLVFRHTDRTLNDKEVDEVFWRILGRLEERLGARLRS